jgi:hypothetical protein
MQMLPARAVLAEKLVGRTRQRGIQHDAGLASSRERLAMNEGSIDRGIGIALGLHPLALVLGGPKTPWAAS